MTRILSLLATLTTLAACGGGSTSNPPSPQQQPRTSAEFRALSADARNADFNTAFTQATPFSDLPTSGSASYDGIAVFQETGGTAPTVVWDGDDPDMLARMTLATDFGSRRVSGRVDRFHDADTGQRLDGALTLTGGLYNDASAVLRGSIAGDMASPRGRDNAGGRFLGNFSDGIGTVSGGMDIQTPSGTWQGLFDAARD